MRVATELYLKQIPVEDIEKALADTNTALDMRKAFGLALGKVQTAIVVSEDTITKEPLEKTAEAYISEEKGVESAKDAVSGACDII